MEEILSRMKVAMKMHKVTQQALAESSGFPRASIDRQLNGDYRLYASTIIALLKLCPVSADWLLRGVGEMNTPHQEQFATINDKLDKILSIVSDK